MKHHEKFTESELEKKATEIMQRFNFEEVHAHMVSTDWKWHQDGAMKIPELDEIKQLARVLLTRVIWEETHTASVGTGGFMAYKMPWGLSLAFQLGSASS
jgi:hypothetical protein